MSQVQTIIQPRGNSVTVFSVATVIMMMLYTLPQVVLFVRNDMMAIIVTVYYALFVSKYVSPAIVLKTLLIGLPYLLIFWLNNFSGNVRLGFVLPFMTLWTLVMPCFAAIAVVKRNYLLEQRFILIATGLCLAYVFISTFQALAIDPLIMREMAGSDDENVHIARVYGAGGYGFAYAVGALFIAIWILNRYMKRLPFWKIASVVLIVICGLLIVESQYATLLFIAVFGVAIHYYLEANTFSKRIKVIAISVVAILASQTLIVLGSSMLGGEVLRFKFAMIYNSIWGGGGIENISGDRSQLQLDAFGLFLQSPLWGYSGAAHLDEYAEAHSSFMAVLASTGIIGVVSFFYLFYSSCRRMLLNVFVNKNERKLYYPVIIFYFLFAWLNPIEYAFECGWMIFFVIPLIYAITFKKANI